MSNGKMSKIVVEKVITNLRFLVITSQTVSDLEMLRTLCRHMNRPS